MNKIITTTSIFILLFSYHYGNSQTQPTRGGGIANVQLEAGSRNVSERKDSTQEIPLGSIQNSSISADGKVIVTNGKIIRLDGPTPREITIPDAENIGYRLNRIDKTGDVLSYGLQERNSYQIKLLSANDGVFMASLTVRKESDFDSLFRMDISENASTVAYTHYNANKNGQNEIYVAEKFQNRYLKPFKLDSVEVVQKPIQLSSTGDRLYYHATVLNSASQAVTYSFIARKSRIGWSEPEPIRINNNRPVVYMDSDDTGKNVLIAAGDLGLAVLSENRTGDGWIEPDYLGITISGLDKVRISGDGKRVYVSKAIPPFSKHLIENRLVEYDLTVYEKVGRQWLPQKLNEDGRNVFGGEFLLSGDGNTLIWRDSEKRQP